MERPQVVDSDCDMTQITFSMHDNPSFGHKIFKRMGALRATEGKGTQSSGGH